YRDWTRGAFTANLILGATALTCAALSIAKPMPWAAHAGAAASAGAVAIYAVASRRRVHHRWIEYRVLPGFLTYSALLMSVGASPKLRSHKQQEHDEFSSWVTWYVKA